MKLQQRSSKGNLAEISVVIYGLFFLMLFPFINLLSLTSSAAVVYFTAVLGATKCAYQNSFSSALSAATDEGLLLNSLAIAKFARLKPVGGLSGTGLDLYVISTNCRDNTAKPVIFGPNRAVPPPIDTLTNVYEYSVTATYEINPQIDMSGIPFFKDVPGLGKPAQIKMSAQRALEHPESLLQREIGELSGGRSGEKVDLGVSGTQTPGDWDSIDADAGWNYPNIYNLIRASGQRVISEDVLRVNANSAKWTNTPIVVSPGQTVWIDTRADSLWSGDGKGTLETANGASIGTDPNGINWFALEGGTVPTGAQDAVDEFTVGSSLFNHQLQKAGTFSLRMKDSVYSDNSGQQVVRIILTGPA